jgi:uncharacterized membrane protein
LIYRLWLLGHLLGVVVWVGGMVFAHFALRPAVATLEAPQRVALMAGALGRFLNMAAWAVVLVLISGLMMMLISSGTRSMFAVPAYIHAMFGIGLLMMAIFGHIRFALYKRLTRAVSANDWPAGGAALLQIRQWVGVNLGLGLLTIIVAVVGPGVI